MLEELIYGIPGLFTAIVFHELAHGWMATLMGDPTPRLYRRLTLNPLAHIDPIGLLMLFVFRFGWAKPVPINPSNFRDPRRGMLLVSVAGPAANFLTAYAAMALMKALGMRPGGVFYTMLWVMIIYNVSLGVFNLIPVPPLDGSKVLASLLPPRHSQWLLALETYGWLVLILLLTSGILGWFLRPMVGMVLSVLDRLSFFLDKAATGLPAGLL